MSNVDVVKRCLDAITRQDTDTLHALSREDVEVHPLRAMLEDTVYRGREGVDQWMSDISESWAELRIETHEISEPEPGHVIAQVTLYGRGHGSDAPTQMRVVLTAQVEDGLVTRAGVSTTG